MVILDRIGKEFRTDKSSDGHNYLQFYERFLAEWRDRDIRVLEIGVGDGASLRMWRKYFPYAQVVGFDHNDDLRKYSDDRIAIEIGDQEKVEDLQRLIDGQAGYDVIIDDGGHSWQQQLTSFKTLVPHLNSPGYYLLEDIIQTETADFMREGLHGIMLDRGTSPDFYGIKFGAVFKGTIVLHK